MCASPNHLAKRTVSDLKDLICTGPVITSTEKDPPPEHSLSELLSAETVREPFGNITLNLSDEHGNKVDLRCRIEAPRESTKVAWEQIGSEQMVANLTLSLDLDCPIPREDYERLWKLIAYYSEVPAHLQREIMLSREPKLSYRYRQDVQQDAYYYTGVRANIESQPSWLMQSFMNLQLNRALSNAKNVKLILGTHFSSNLETEMIRRQRREWVMIEHNNRTQTAMSAVKGGMIEMDCFVLSSGHPSVQWMLPDGSKIKAPYTSANNRIAVSSSGKLVIKALSHADAGVYYCIAEVKNDLDFLPFRLAVVESSAPPPGDKAGPAVTHSVGEPISLPCITSAAPDAEIYWIFPDGSKANINANSSKAYVLSNGTLFIPHSHLSNNGYYKCVAVNQHGTDTLAAKVTITQREGLQPLRRYPMRPQSAAGISTKIKAFVDDTDESSGDYGIWGKTPNNPDNVRTNGQRVPHTRTHEHPHRHPQRRPHGPRKPIRKGYHGQNRKNIPETRRNSGTSKVKIDPQKWADILAKIRQRTGAKPTAPSPVHTSSPPKPTAPSPAHTSSPVEEVHYEDLSNSKRPEPGDSTEGSTPDDAGLPGEGFNVLNTPQIPSQIPRHQTVIAPTHTEDQTNDIYQIYTPKSDTVVKEQTPFLSTDVKPTKASDYTSTAHVLANTMTISTEHVLANTMTVRAETGLDETQTVKMGNNKAFSVLQTTPQPKHAVNIEDTVIPSDRVDAYPEVNTNNKVDENSLTSLFTTSSPAAKSRPTAIAKKGPPFNSVPSRSNVQWNSRRRYGNRRRMNRLRPRPPMSRLTTPRPQQALASTIPSPLVRSTEPSPVRKSTLPTTGPFTKDTISLSESTLSAQDDKMLTQPGQGSYDEVEPGRPQVPPESTSATLLSLVTAQGKPQGYEHTASSGAIPTSEPGHKSSPVAAGHEESTQVISDLKMDVKILSENVATTLNYMTSHVSPQSEVNYVHASREPTSPPPDRDQDFSSVKDFSNQNKNNEKHFKESSPNIPATIKPVTTVSASHHGTPSTQYRESPPSVTQLYIRTTQHEHSVVSPIAETPVAGKNRDLLPKQDSDVEQTVITATTIEPTNTPDITTPAVSTATVLMSTTTTATPKTTALSTTASSRLRLSLTLPGNNRVSHSSKYPGGNYIPDRHSGRIPSTNYRYPFYPNNKTPFIIRRPDTNPMPSVTTSPERNGKVNPQKSTNAEAPKTTSAAATSTSTTTIPTTVSKTLSSTKFKGQNQTGQSSNSRHSSTVFSPNTYDGSSQRPAPVPGLKAKPKITTSNIYTFIVNASTDVLLPCDAVGGPKPFLTWTKVSTGRRTLFSSIYKDVK